MTRPIGSPDPQRLELKQAIDDRAVRMAFQPIVDLATGAAAGLEALCRPGTSTGFDSPHDLFCAAERLRMLWPLECVTRGAAFEAAGAWPFEARLFLNCSPLVVSDPRFAGAISAGVDACKGLTPARVVLEITERSDHRHSPGLIKGVARLKEMGFHIAIDDVGAGMSGLNRIMELRPHWLKLDRGLISGIDRDRYRRSLVGAISLFTADSGIRLVAEGVEREAELDAVASLGVGHAQGYYLSRPVDRLDEVPPTFRTPPTRGCRAA